MTRCAVLILAGTAAYGNSLQGVFVFDDLSAIFNNRAGRDKAPGRVFFVSSTSVYAQRDGEVVRMGMRRDLVAGRAADQVQLAVQPVGDREPGQARNGDLAVPPGGPGAR